MATTQEVRDTTAVPPGPPRAPEASEAMRLGLILSLSEEMNDRIEDLVRRSGYDRGELINMAIALFKASLDAVEDGKRVGIVDDDREIYQEFMGFHRDDPTSQ